MALPNRSLETARNRMLLILPAQPGFEILNRITSTVCALEGELIVFCPFVEPRVPITDVSLTGPEQLRDHDATRASARRFAHGVAAKLERQGIDAHVEFGLCPTLTGGVLEAAKRFGPDLLILPKVSRAGVFDSSYTVAYEEIWSELGISTLIMHDGAVAEQSILGLISLDTSSNDGTSIDERVAAATTELAKAFDAEAHLLCSDSKPKVVELAEAALSMNVTKTSGNETRNAIRDLEKIARRFEIPIERIHRRNGKENHAIERVIDPLGAGLIVTHYRPGTIFGGLFPHNAMPKPADARCDLLVLGGNHEPIS